MKIDLNDLRVFERVASLGGFSAAATALALPKSSVSRAVSRLEQALGVRLLQRTTRDVSMTAAGLALRDRCGDLLSGIDNAMADVAGFAETPRGHLIISAGIGFGINVLGRELPGFVELYPDVTVALDLTSRNAELVAEKVDIAIRMGSLGDSTLVATRLGEMTQYLCATPDYLDAHGRPQAPDELRRHRVIDMPGVGGRPRSWRLTRGGVEAIVEPRSRITVNDALTICALVGRGAGIGPVSAYLCGGSLLDGKLERILPRWALPTVPVSLVFPSRRELSPVVRSFVDYMRRSVNENPNWLADPYSPRDDGCS
ncbi:LysR family transcriptional regulator [Sphingomonas hankookensis]|uniref:LysR family transcriptional regulator n=1 Tax=Sphingomonas hankookensis TaxID=563996 RepID=UPI001F56BF78|nr:LysR family transcriptional regulator [Sphingomonas hankookensis]